MPDRKAFTAHIELKAAPSNPGEFRATFATFDAIDKDGDVTLPGAFTDGQAVRIAAWGHDWGALPVGKGVIHQDKARAWVDGEFFLDTPQGAAHHATVKNLGALQEWSYGFSVKEWSVGEFEAQQVRFLRALDVYEVSPVMIGAGVGTHTDAVKAFVAANEPKAFLLTDEPKVGARNSGTDMARIQSMHDLTAELGAACATKSADPPPPPEAQPEPEGLPESQPEVVGAKSLEAEATLALDALDALAERLGSLGPDAVLPEVGWLAPAADRAERSVKSLASIARLAAERESSGARGLERAFRRLETLHGFAGTTARGRN